MLLPCSNANMTGSEPIEAGMVRSAKVPVVGFGECEVERVRVYCRELPAVPCIDPLGIGRLGPDDSHGWVDSVR